MILHRLKAETAELHRAVEASNNARYIMDGTINQNQYEELLRQNFKVYKAVEDCINARYDVLPETLKAYAGYLKTNALAKDITGFSNVPLPQPERVVSPRKLPALIGMMYVIEGSMLGGMMISKKIQKCSHLDHIDAHHFFSKDNKKNVLRWQSFKEAVLSLKLTDADIDEAIHSAKETFLLFKSAFAKA